MNYIAKIEGQEIPLPEEIGATDEAVKKALAPFYPEVAGALITRITKDETTTLTVVKKAGSKGAGEGVDALRAALGGKNPAFVVYDEIRHMGADEPIDAAALLELDRRIGDAIITGNEQAAAVIRSQKRLQAAVPQPADALIEGF
jgi:hypothetical protein